MGGSKSLKTKGLNSSAFSQKSLIRPGARIQERSFSTEVAKPPPVLTQNKSYLPLQQLQSISLAKTTPIPPGLPLLESYSSRTLPLSTPCQNSGKTKYFREGFHVMEIL